MEKPLISVIVPTYNDEKYLDNAIRSVLFQRGRSELFDLDIIICDDCSKDGTIKIAEYYVQNFGCRLIKNEYHTGGPNHGRNNGLKNARGHFIAFLDQDDNWFLDKLIMQLPAFEKYRADLVFSNFVGVRIKTKYDSDSDIYERMRRVDFSTGGIYISSILLRNENIPQFRDFQLDYPWILEVIKDRRCVSTPPLVRRNGESLSMTKLFRMRDYYMKIDLAGSDRDIIKRINASYARYHYKHDSRRVARYYFLRSPLTWKNVGYYLTSYNKWLSEKIVKRYGVFG